MYYWILFNIKLIGQFLNIVLRKLQNILISSGNTRNSLDKDFGTLLFGDTPDNVSESAIKVDDQSGTTTFTNA